MRVHWKLKITINQSLHFFLSDKLSGNLNILFEDLTFVVGLQRKSYKNSENLLELLVFKFS